MTPMRSLLAVLTTIVLTASLGFASRAAYTPKQEHDALLRLSWRMRTKSLRSCRRRTEAELASLPAHMRAPEVCTTQHLDYRLIVRVDDWADTVRVVTGGAKGDRPFFVLHDVPVSPGPRDVHVDFQPEQTNGPATKAVLTYRGTVDARAGRINLITLSQDAAGLVLVSR